MTCTRVDGIRGGGALPKGSSRCSDGELAATQILDWRHPQLQRLDSVIDRASAPSGGGFLDTQYLAAAHAVVQRRWPAAVDCDVGSGAAVLADQNGRRSRVPELECVRLVP